MSSGPFLWVGLGNVGKSYARNRHNYGFMAVDAIHDHWNFEPWKKRFSGEVSVGMIEGSKIVLLKPHTLMNLSGSSVQQACKFFNIPTENVLVFHDEMGLVVGGVRYKFGGGAAGHNGLRSLDQSLASSDYGRIRLGVDRPAPKMDVTAHVLGNFTSDEFEKISDVLVELSSEASLLAQGDLEAFEKGLGSRGQKSIR